MAAQDESLRLVAEVVDKFSGPLRNLRTMLQGVQAGPGVDKLKTGLEGSQKAATALSREVGNTLTPALNAAGIAGLSVSGALLGVGAALRSFTGSTASLALLSRETRMTVDAMRTLEEVGKRFDLAPEAMRQSFTSFSENAQQLRKGLGDVTGFLMSQSPTVAKWAADLQKDLAKGLDPDVAYRRALEFMRRIQDPIDRGRFAEKLFGNKQLGILGSEDIGKVIDEVQKQLGRLPQGAAANALAFKHSWDEIITSLIGFRDAVAISIMPTLKEMTDAFGKFVQSPEFKEGLSSGLKSIADTLRDIDWKKFKQEMGDFFGVVGREARAAFEGIKLFAEIIGAVREGRLLDALKLLDSKPVLPESYLGKPKTDDDKRVEELEKRKDQMQRMLTVLDAPINRRSSEQTQQRDKLTNEIKELTDEIKKLREAAAGNGATVQQQSSDGTGLGGLIQKAAFGAMVQSGNMLQNLGTYPQGGGSGGGGAGGSRSSGAAGGASPQGTGGSRSWRNNNPGNLEFGPFARSSGALGSDGRFAVFPDYATGRKAQEKLLFESKNYRNLSLGQALNRWAPGSENDVPAYIKAMGGDNPNKPMSEYSPAERARLLDLMQKHEGWRPGVRPGAIDTGPLRIKGGPTGQATAGGPINQAILDTAKAMQSFGGIKEFTGFNDLFHARRGGGQHPRGMAGDFTLQDSRQSAAIAERLRDHYRGAGLKEGPDFKVLDEYRFRSPGATGGHIHYELRNREAAEAYRAYTIREGARRAKEMAESGGGFNETVQALRGQSSKGFELPKLGNGDDMLRKALRSPLMRSAPVDLKGGATLDINFKNPPAGMSTSTSSEGILKDLNVRRASAIPKAGVDI